MDFSMTTILTLKYSSFVCAILWTTAWVHQLIMFVMSAYHDREHEIKPRYQIVMAGLWGVFMILCGMS